MRLKWFLLVAVLLLGGCKDLLNAPLKGDGKSTTKYQLAGTWIEEGKGTQLELKKMPEPDWFQFVMREPDRMIEGKLMVAAFKYKLALSVDVASLTINGEPLVREGKQGYFLVGAYYSDDELRIVPVNARKFERNFADYYFATPIDPASFCPRTNAMCKNTFTGGHVLSPKNRRKFNEDFERYFRTVFPRSDSAVFIPSR